MSLPIDRQPVIVGVGEVMDRPAVSHDGLEPMRLMLDALRDAERDAGVPLLKHIDTLDVVREVSWPYLDPVGLLASHLQIDPPRKRYGEDGGESPIRFLHEAALRIQRGEAEVAAVVGAEAGHTTAAAWKAGVQLQWPHRDKAAKLPNGRDLCGPLAIAHGAILPTQVYPFFENAAVAHWGQTQAEGIEESAQVCSALSRTAAMQINAWSREVYEPAAVSTPSAHNRMIAWPYTKRMVANPMVNQGAAVLVTSRGRAREWGIPDERMIHVWGGAHANECRDYLLRDRYYDSSAQRAVLESVKQRISPEGDGFSAIELYSCFPIVPKMARRVLGLPAEHSFSVTGGLNFFGAPLNNYMAHATVAMVRQLRDADDGRPGLLYGQGEYVTKHHAVVLGRVPDEGRFDDVDPSVQAQADALKSTTPELSIDHEGKANIETFTVLYGRDQQPEHGVVIARTPEGTRLMARVPASDQDTMSLLLRDGQSPVGSPGTVRLLDKGLLGWSVA
jgi:acetyl-CoA C-acetyltransferase